MMPPDGLFSLNPATIADLPIESLALLVLQNYAENGGWNRRNWMLGAETALGRGSHINVLAEAWSWLEAHSLVAPSPDQSSAEARIVTRAGKVAIERASLKEIVAAERIALDLHPRFEGKIRPIFLLGDYETAAFKAMKEVEVRVRELSGLPNDMIGITLMRQAFHP